MSNYEKEASIMPPIFDGSNIVYWKVRTTTYLQSLGIEVWDIVEGGYTFPSVTPSDTAAQNRQEIWDKIILSYEGDDQVKCAKLQSLRIQYETLRMQNDESVANYFLRIDEIVNCMKNLGKEIKEVTLVEKVLRSLSSKFDSKVSTIEEKKNLQIITMSQMHGILTTFEMRKGGPLDMREATFKASGKGAYNESRHTS
eukprot:PITA_08098